MKWEVHAMVNMIDKMGSFIKSLLTKGIWVLLFQFPLSLSLADNDSNDGYIRH